VTLTIEDIENFATALVGVINSGKHFSKLELMDVDWPSREAVNKAAILSPAMPKLTHFACVECCLNTEGMQTLLLLGAEYKLTDLHFSHNDF
jgi:hypothetical protein